MYEVVANNPSLCAECVEMLKYARKAQLGYAARLRSLTGLPIYICMIIDSFLNREPSILAKF